jgi:hypothetical protein
MQRTNQTQIRVRPKRRTGSCIRIILALGLCVPAFSSQGPPPDLARRVANREMECERARQDYMYRQTVTLEELDHRGVRVGMYREVRDIIFSPEKKRIEQPVGQPLESLKSLRLTEEDFRDIREVQPFLFTPDELWLYETRFRGEEKMDGIDCWLLEVGPRQILQGQRLFKGLFWVSKSDYSIVRSQGQAVPQIRRTKAENLFPHFTTLRAPVDGKYWFPVQTHGDDTLYFRTGSQRVRLTIKYESYRRFSTDSTINYEKTK